MPLPKLVKIGDKEVTHVLDVRISVKTPEGDGGVPGGNTEAAMVTLKRMSRHAPSTRLFKYASKPNKGAFKATIVLQTAMMKETYRFEIKEAIISKYEFDQGEEDTDVEETITMTVWDMEVFAEGSRETYKVTDSNAPDN